MYLTMNRFKVREGHEAAFEAVWTGRDSHLPAVKGFKAFHLMKGPVKDGYRLYASHTMWDSEADFVAWTRSEAFRAAHHGARAHAEMYLGPPELECYESVQAIGG